MKIGDRINCEICGAEFIVESPSVKYCKNCRENKMNLVYAKNLRNAYDRMEIRIPKGEKQTYIDHAEKMGESLNQFLVRSIKNQLSADTASAGVETKIEIDTMES